MKIQLGLWAFLFALGFANVIVRDTTFCFELFVHDFSNDYGEFSEFDTRLTRFLYHIDLMITPAIWCLIALLPREPRLNPLWGLTLVWYLKSVMDVIICNNTCNTFWLDNICYICMVIVAYWGWIHKTIYNGR